MTHGIEPAAPRAPRPPHMRAETPPEAPPGPAPAHGAVHEAFETITGTANSTLVLLADHASNRLPEGYPPALGLDPAEFERHIAYDIGVEGVTRRLAATLGAPAVLSRFSRLLIDPNRGEDDPTLIMRLSDGAIVPANHALPPGERRRRIESYWRPYDEAVRGTIKAAHGETGQPPVVVSIHSFTPYWRGVPRPWHAGVLWDGDARVARPLIEALDAAGDIVVGDNEPYSGALGGDMMNRQCHARGLPHALLEIRQDLIADEAGQAAWADRLAPLLAAIDARPDIHAIEHHRSDAR